MAAATDALARCGISSRMLRWPAARNEAHPFADAARAKRMVDRLPAANPLQRIEEVNRWLNDINELPSLPLARRYEAIALLDTASRCAQARLLEDYFALSDERSVEQKRLWKTMMDYWTLLGNGYRDCARQCGDAQALPRPLRAQLPLLAARGLRALRHQIKWTLFRYGSLRVDLWEECGTLLALAEAASAVTQPIELYEAGGQVSSPGGEFLRLAMFWTLSPNGLAPLEQELAERLVLQLTPKFRLSPWQEDACDFFFDLAGRHPPLRWVRSSPWSPATRYIEVGEARQAARAMHAMAVGSGHLPPGLDVGHAADATGVARVLDHMLRNWARELPPRAAARRKAALRLNAVQGYREVLRAIAPESAAGSAQPAGAETPLTYVAWTVDDVSAGGYGVIAPAGTAEALCVGQLVALRSTRDADWQVGVVRRVQAHAQPDVQPDVQPDAQVRSARHLGIELLAHAALGVQVRSLSSAAREGKRDWAILLSERPSPDGSLDILVRRDLMSMREAIEARYGTQGMTLTMKPGRLVQSGADFDWLRYQLSAPIPLEQISSRAFRARPEYHGVSDLGDGAAAATGGPDATNGNK